VLQRQGFGGAATSGGDMRELREIRALSNLSRILSCIVTTACACVGAETF